MRRIKVAVLVAEHEAEPPLDGLPAAADVRVAASPVELGVALDGAEALFVWDYRTAMLRDAWPHAANLRWIHTASIGVDGVMVDRVVESDVVVTNTRGVFEQPLAEYVLALLLLFAKDLRRTLALQARHEWSQRQTEVVRGRRMLIIGAGHIARELAPLARGLGMEVDVVGRTARDGDPALRRVHAVADVDGLLGRADDVVLALPLTAETRGFMDTTRIAAMRRGARLVNVGRGALVDDAALIDALRTGHVAAAGLDVFEPEPLPAQHPYWDMEQVVVSPHMSADFEGWERLTVDLFAANLERMLAGEPLRNVVDKTGFRAPAGA